MHFWQGYGDVRIAGDSWGEPGSPLVVLLHGGGQTRHAWKGTGQRLADVGYHAVAFDARGHGDSAWAPDGLYTQAAMVSDLLAVVKELGESQPVLGGASMGGGTALVAVGENHLDADALVLVDVAPRVEPDGIEKIQEFMRQYPDGFESLEQVAEAIANYQPHQKRERRLDGLAKNVRLGDDGRFHWHWDPRTRAQEIDFAKREAHLEKCSRNLTVPTLLVRGGLSDILSEEGALRFLELCPTSEYVNVTGAAHMVAGDRNDIFATSVINFLARHASTGTSSTRSTHAVRPVDVGSSENIPDIP